MRALQVEMLEQRLCLAADAPFLPGEVLVQFDVDATPQDREAVRGLANAALKREIHTATMQAAGVGVLDRLELPGNMPVHAAIELFNANPHVVVAEPNYVITTAAISNDPGYTAGNLWGMESDDSPVDIGPAGTTNAFGSQAEEAWYSGVTGSSSIYVGVIDEGFQYTHPDLNDNAWVNPGETAGDGVDNDENGYIDDVYGWDFYSGDNTPYDGSGDDHGTHVAGTIGGAGNNSLGVAGVNWDVTMISAKFLGPAGGSTAGAIEAVDYITDLKTRHNIDIVATNNSWGGGGYSSLLEAAIIRGANEDILFFAAAGNSGANIDAGSYYPASYSTIAPQDAGNTAASYEAVIAVASITSTGALSSFSNYGATKVDIGAPGSSIYSTLPTDSYGTYSGTSMATPHVAGAAALFASTYPEGSRPSAAEIRNALLQSAAPTTSLDGITVTGGRLDVNAALALANPPGLDVSITTTSDSDQDEGNSGTKAFTFEISLDQTASSADPITVDYQIDYTGAADAADFNFGTFPASGSVTFNTPDNPATLSQTITIEVAGDVEVEPDETFEVHLTQVSTGNAGLWRDRATGTIRADDARIEGTVWYDGNGDGSFDQSESGQSGITVFVDANEDGALNGGEVSDVTAADGSYSLLVAPGTHLVRLDLAAGQQQTHPLYASGSLEPDNYANGTVLNDVLSPNVTLTAVGSSIANANVYAQAENYASTGANAFASTWNTGLWNTLDAELRVDFSTNVNSVSIDAISDDSSDVGHLRAYNSSGNLLQEYVTGNLGTGVSETMTITRASNEISYVLASGRNGQHAWLDNLVFDSVDDGTAPALPVSVGGTTSSNNNFGITTNDVLTLEIDPGSVAENAGAAAATATVTRSSDTTDALIVTISSSDDGEATGAASVTISAGSATATFPINAVDDLLVDGTQSVTFTVTAAGHSDGQATLDVTDNDDPIFAFFDADSPGGDPNPGSAIEGDVTSTHVGDPPTVTGNYFVLEESAVQVGGSAKKPKLGSALEYHFSFSALDSVSAFYAIAQRTAGDDDFRIEYSSDGGNNWTLLGTVNQTTDQSIDVSGLNLSGNVLVRIIDTDRSPSNGNSTPTLDRVSIKAIYFEQAIYDLRVPVTVQATADAEEAESPINGEFTFTRDGTAGDLIVYYTVGGTATPVSDPDTPGGDYTTLSGSALIPAGSDSVAVPVKPLNDDTGEVTESVIVTLSENDSYGYRASMPNSATVNILDDDLATFTATGETTVDGEITDGTFVDTKQANEGSGGAPVVETIREYRTGGKPSNRITYMDHRWAFDGVAGANSFYVSASRSDNTESDDFKLSYGVDDDGDFEPDAGWTEFSFSINTPILSIYSAAVSGLSGRVLVKVEDTGPNNPGDSSQDTFTVDHMYFSTATHSPLQLEAGHQTEKPSAQPVTIGRQDLSRSVEQAIAHWSLHEPHAEATHRLAETRFEVMPLGGSTVGLAFPHENRVWIDTDAGGYGWDRVSLRETLIHEVGHLYGHQHDVLGASITPLPASVPQDRDWAREDLGALPLPGGHWARESLAGNRAWAPLLRDEDRVAAPTDCDNFFAHDREDEQPVRLASVAALAHRPDYEDHLTAIDALFTEELLADGIDFRNPISR